MHRSIVTPLAATIAATLAVGVGLALAKSGRGRRDIRPRRLDRRLGLGPGEPLGEGLRRMALGQIDLALELLQSESDGAIGAIATQEQAVHETRKALKRLRALLRLLEHTLGEDAFARENTALRETAQRLSGARDATVMLGTLDRLIAAHRRTLARRGGVVKLRRRLAAEHERMQLHTLGDPDTRAAVIAELRGLRHRVGAWELPERDDIQLVETDLARLYRQGRRRYRRVLRGRGEEMLAMHDWRKRVKDLRYAAEMLERRGAGGRLPQLARRADALGELLGEDHDLAVLAERLRAGARWDGRQTWRTGRRSRKTLLDLIARRRRELRKLALREGARLYRRKPKRFMRRFRAAHHRALRQTLPER